MTKAEFLKIAEERWTTFESLKEETNFYDYEKKFDKMMIGLGQELLDKELKGEGEDRRKKKKSKLVTGKLE